MAADPEGFLGPAHVAAFGRDPGLLVKLLDTGERLFAHFHPDRAFARTVLGSRYGKSEAWIVVDVAADAGPGGRDPAGRCTWASTGRFRPGRWPPGWPSSASATCSPPSTAGRSAPATATSCRAASRTPSAPASPWWSCRSPRTSRSCSNCGRAPRRRATWASATRGRWRAWTGPPGTRTAWDADRLAALCGPGRPTGLPGLTRLLPAESEAFFRAERLVRADPAAAPTAFPAEYGVWIVLAGEGALSAASGTVPLAKGTVLLVPYGAGPTEVSGRLDVVRCLPAAPAGRA
ncbi:hypothetical protein [Streptomyces hoynatensis]|uniref:hypothetical protein n=1 Tax=Streptomyces hoynatensis TaxID=1141874 RepID=UPI0019D44BC9|nr:hypothetical protein [Streptomyces hoynatensis]